MIRFLFFLSVFPQIAYGQDGIDKYSIYSLIINEELNQDGLNTKHIFIENKTGNPQGSESIYQIMDFVLSDMPILCSYPDKINELLAEFPVIKDLLITLDLTSQNNVSLENSFNIDCQYSMISRRKLNRLFKNSSFETWNKLRSNYPGLLGVIDFSDIVTKNGYAVVYYGLHKQALNAVGKIVILKKTKDDWVILSRSELWVS
ncbi:MAG: hypothetical protein R2804_07785 [Cyclobacteriaceae bacterium]